VCVMYVMVLMCLSDKVDRPHHILIRGSDITTLNKKKKTGGTGDFYVGTILREGHAVAQLFEALRYKSEVRGFDSRWCHWKFSLT
jgi:hypothetical protein